MTAIPTEALVVTKADMIKWEDMKKRLAVLKAEEMALRIKIYGAYFPNAEEGTNSHSLAEGWLLKAGRKIDRKVDIGTLQAMSVAPEGEVSAMSKVGIDPNELIKWVPELELKKYRGLTDDQRKVFDQALIIKDGSPSLEIVLPAAAKKAAARA